MLNLSIALSNAFNPRRQGKLPPISDRLLLLPAHKLSSMIKEGKLSSVRLCELLTERIKQVQPLLNCVCQERFAEALDEARQLDSLLADIRSGAKQHSDCSAEELELLGSPLLGVPVSVKESIQVRGMRNTCGLWSRRNVIADEDSVVVRNLRRFGMIPICTTNVPECTLFWADCQNRVYGRSLNPYDQSRITGASSGGEGALLGSGGSLIGLGSDIGGSLRIPAHWCGVNSHKPSPFLVSSEGNFPPVKDARLRMFTLGPMCRFASDLRPLLKCLLRDHNNPKADTYFRHQPSDIGRLRAELLSKLDEPVDLTRVKLLYFNFNESSQLQGKQAVRVSEELARAQRELISHFETKFNCKTEHVNLDRFFKKILITWQCMLRCAGREDRDEAYENAELMRIFGIKSVTAELLKMPFGLSKHTKESLLAILMGSSVPDDRDKAYELCERFEAYGRELRAEINKLLGARDTGNGNGNGNGRTDGDDANEAQRDTDDTDQDCVLIMPTLPSVAYKHNVSLMKTPDLRFPALFNALQLPVSHATLRLDEAHGLPFGFSIATRPYADHLSLAVAEEIELAFGGWTPPSKPNARSQTHGLGADASDPIGQAAGLNDQGPKSRTLDDNRLSAANADSNDISNSNHNNGQIELATLDKTTTTSMANSIRVQ